MITTEFKFEYESMDIDGKCKLTITSGWNNSVVLDYYGPHRLMHETVAIQAIGQAIMSQLDVINRHHKEKERTKSA